jgi:DNA-binding IclR family transcriptional regulator
LIITLSIYDNIIDNFSKKGLEGMSAEKTLEILDLFSFNSKELMVHEMAKHLDLPISSVYRYVRILKHKGYLTEKEDGIYKLGYRFLEMANMVKSDNSLSTLALPVMKELTKKTEETSILTIISGCYAVCLETVLAYHPIKVSAEQGSILPLHAGASSKTLLAYQSHKFVKELFQKGYIKQLTPNTITDPKILDIELNEIREKGYSISDEEVDKMVFAYGVPIRNTDQQVIAALSTAGPRERILEKDKSFYLDALFEASETLQKHL